MRLNTMRLLPPPGGGPSLSWLRLGTLVLPLLALFLVWRPLLAGDESIFNRDVEDAEMLFFRGDYDKAIERIRVAKDGLRDLHFESVRRRAVNVDVVYLESVLDILKAQVRTGQGYTASAKGLLEQAGKRLYRRAAALAKSGATVDDLAFYNYQLGFIQMCLGEVTLKEAEIEAAISNRETSRRKCIGFFEEGSKLIRGTFRNSGFRDFDLQLRLLNYCELRLAHMMVITGDAGRARTFFDDARELLETDVYWAEQFHPEGKPKTFSNGVGGASKVATPDNKGGGPPTPPGGPAPGPGTAPATPGAADEAVITAFDSNNQQTLDASTNDRHRIRTAIFYIQLLDVQAELELLSGHPFLAEEAASRARDIAEEQCGDSMFHAETLATLSSVCCDCFTEEMELAAKVSSGSVQRSLSTSDVHELAAQTYLADAKEFVEAAERIADSANPAQPIHFQILAVRRKLGKLRNDKSALEALDVRCREMAKLRAEDKPKAGKTDTDE